jgi:hypothetical protein
VHEWWSVLYMQERRDRALAEAEERRLALLVAGAVERPSLRARAARWLFRFAVALEREETWRAVWERLEAPRRP